MECFQLANKLSPEDPEILHLLGSQLFHLGNTKSAVSALLRAHALQPNRPDILNDLGATYVALGRLKDAEGMLLLCVFDVVENVSLSLSLSRHSHKHTRLSLD